MPESPSTARVGPVVAAVVATGLVLVLAVLAWAPHAPIPGGSLELTAPSVVALFVALAVLSEWVYVPLSHGESTEDLTFLEALVVAGMLVLAPTPAVLAPLAGLAIVSVLLRRPWVKTLFNLGSYAAATAVMVGLYLLLAQGEPRFSVQSVVAMTLATMAFTAVNLIAYAAILRATSGARLREVVTDEWQLSATMAVGGVGIGAVAVLLIDTSPALLPFVLLPVLALWYAYRSAASQARERDRNASLVVVGAALASHSSTEALLAVAPDAIRAAAGAGAVEVVMPGDAAIAALALTGPTELTAADLPKGWTYGVAVPMDTGGTTVGALLLGTPAGAPAWRLEPRDTPMLATLVASLGSALRGSHTHEALVQETGKLKAVVEHATDGIVVVSDTDEILVWSPAMELISGLPAALADSDLQTRPQSARLLTAAAGLPGQLYDPRAPGETPPFPGLALPTRESLLLGLTRPDGEVRDVQVSIVRIQDEADGSQLAILTVHDVTRERRIDRLKSDFVATISHELRTPITPIKGYAQLLATRGDRMTPERRQEALLLIAERADHLGRLVDDLLLASRVSGEDGAKLGTVEADENLTALVADAAGSFPALDGRLEVRLPDGPVPVRCDAVRTTQCLANLISNAAKYSPEHSPIVVTLHEPDPDGPFARVTVTDLGPGIATSEHERIFERFYRLEDPMTMSTGGSGLGLYIARELARAQGGDLTLASEAGKGCTFSLDVPLVGVSAGAVAGSASLPYPRETP